MGKHKEFKDEPGGSKRKGAKKAHIAGSVNETALIECEGRDYVYRCALAIRRANEIRGELKVIEKRIKVTVEKLSDEMNKGVVEGGKKGQTRIPFPSLEAVELQAQSVSLDHIEIGLGMCNRLLDVPATDLERVRKAMNAAVDSAVTTPAEEDGKSSASGGNGQNEAVG